MIRISRKPLLFLSLLALPLAVCSCGGEGAESTDKVPAPYILNVITDYNGKAVAGKPVTLSGLNFSPVAAENKVIYGVGLDAVSLPVYEASEEHVVFTAPTVSESSLKIMVSTKGKESNWVNLEYTTIPDDGPDDPVDDPTEEPWSDTPTIVFDGAQTVTVREGVEWTSFHGKWEGQVRNINIVRTKLNEHNHLGIYFNYSTEGLLYLDEKCTYLDALAGTNGPMACCQFVRVNGEIKHASTDTDPWIANCALTIDGDVVDIVKVKDNYKAARLTNAANGSYNYPDNTLTVGCAGPLLVWEGKIQENPQEWIKADKNSWLSTTHPRTAIGLSKDGKTVIQVAVDGRWTKSSFDERAIGMSTQLLAKLMRGLGCYKAMNFDGGGGTAMWVYGYGNSRNIVNRVCENSDWNGTTLRSTGCAVYIKSDLK